MLNSDIKAGTRLGIYEINDGPGVVWFSVSPGSTTTGIPRLDIFIKPSNEIIEWPIALLNDH